MPEKEIAARVVEIFTTGGIAAGGGGAHYLYKISKGEKFKISMFVLNIALAFFIGFVVGDFLPRDMGSRDGILAISGFSSFPILSFLENGGYKIILRSLGWVKIDEETKQK